ncbi:hypothetical protein [Varibaculum vaginae]|uniref:hypothetical protein n=1 Tax=Varibaculum vaginae TaxID=2364797 RepID=UPI000F08E61F|nr:hypothetical protein [Varibaculum vaginae]
MSQDSLPSVDTPADPVVSWTVQEGAMVAAKLDPAAVCRFFQEQNIVAEADWFPDTPNLLGVNMLRNQADGLASLDEADQPLRVGAALPEVVEKLAEKFAADVLIGEYQANKLPADTPVPSRNADSTQRVRVVEISQMPVTSVPFCAASEGKTLGCITLPQGRVALFYETIRAEVVEGSLISRIPALGLYVSDHDQRIVAVTSDENADPEKLAIHSWSLKNQVVPGAVENPDSLLLEKMREYLGHSSSPKRIAETAGCDAEQLAETFKMPGQDGMVRAIEVLGLPAEAAAFLYGRLELEDVPGIEIFHEPGWAAAMGQSVDMRILQSAEDEKTLFGILRKLEIEHPILMKVANISQLAVGIGLLGAGLVGIAGKRRFSKLSLLGGIMLALDSGLRSSVVYHIKNRTIGN